MFYKQVFISALLLLLFSNTRSQEATGGDYQGAIETLLLHSKQESLTTDQKSKKIKLAEHFVQKMVSDTVKLRLLSQIANRYYGIRDYQKFKETTIAILEMAKLQKNTIKVGKCYYNLGLSFNRTKQNDSAYYNYLQASKIFEKLDEHKLAAGVYEDIAKVQKSIKDYVGSEVTSFKALTFCKRDPDFDIIFGLYNNLGIITSELGRFKDALQYHDKAKKAAFKSSFPKINELTSLNNIGLVFEKQGLYGQAVSVYQDALRFQVELQKYPGFKAVILDNIAYAKFKGNKRSQLPELFLESLRICDSLQDSKGQLSIKLHLAEYYSAIDSVSRSKAFAMEALDIAHKYKYNGELLTALLQLSKISKDSIGLQYAQQYIALNDSLLSNERKIRDQFSRIRFETNEITEEKEKVTKQKNWLVFGVIGLLASLILVYVVFRQRQHTKELLYAQEQQEANEEIYKLIMSQQTKLEEGRALEKRRMSEELHDGVLSRLFGTRLGLDGLNQHKDDHLAYERNKYIVELSAIENEIRRISHDLSSSTFISEVAFVEVVEKLIREHSKLHNLEEVFYTDPNIDWEIIDDSVKINLYRIIQETLQNVVRHSQAKSVEIKFTLSENTINLIILDDGIGFKNSGLKPGIGLKNIKSRSKTFNGFTTFENQKTGGAKITVSIPHVEDIL